MRKEHDWAIAIASHRKRPAAAYIVRAKETALQKSATRTRAMKEPDTRVWREQHGLSRSPEAVLFYSPNLAIFAKLKGVLHLHQLSYSAPLPNTTLVAGEMTLLSLAVTQWQELLTADECAQVRGSLLESCTPSAADLAFAPLHLEDLGQVVARMQTRWLVKLLAANSVSVVFQPLISLATRSCVACECLVRGDYEGTQLGAERMLSAARILGVSHDLDHAAWRAALQQGQALMQGGTHLFLNFTPSSVYNAAFDVKKMKSMCHEMGVEMSQLVFEVTEAEKIHDFEFVKRVMQDYRAEGAKIALDDLGSGYSSILRLADLQPDYVKLDQRLAHGAYGDKLRYTLLKAIADASHKLGVLVVAEGVESEEDLKFCVEIGADLVQGYFMAYPAAVPPAVSPEALRALERICGQTPVAR
jgi:EAL domain-containing protein (putative c-di-GMP-specific phosphodiesterase class I)